MNHEKHPLHSTNLKVGGSNPSGRAIFIRHLWHFQDLPKNLLANNWLTDIKYRQQFPQSTPT